jgi:hypothetical protein
VTLTTRFHRTTALAAGLLLGPAGALAGAGPVSASATVPVVATATLTSSASCNPDGWTVSWKLKTADTAGADGVFSNVKSSIPVYQVPPGGGLPGLPPPDMRPPALKTFADGGTVTGDGEFTEDQSFRRLAAIVELKLTVTWPLGANGHTSANVVASAKIPDCHTPQPTGSVAQPPPFPPGEGNTYEDDTDEDDNGAGTPGQSTAPAAQAPSSSVTTSASASASASPSAGPSVSTELAGVGGLALTGAAAGSFGGGAALLLLVGAALFVVARRRKAKFTA